ncbi:acetate kinase [Ectothiorhodospiraceae bacterium BW-2]|nr:acetate kinase [Ectothiorhodospiraceae bacterium BW-2]
MQIFVINCGSSSIKFTLFEMAQEQRLVEGAIERIGSHKSELSLHLNSTPITRRVRATDHAAALTLLLAELEQQRWLTAARPPDLIAHRVVHGGNCFYRATLITPSVLQAISEVSQLAPLHNPPNVQGIEAMLAFFGQVPQVACFDTAFHHQLPEVARTWALDRQLVEQYQLRRYGFHGLSHDYVTAALADYLQRPRQQLRLISLHLGNGASGCAVRDGQSIDTTMGFTPTDGLVMGSRCGELDPGVVLYLQQQGFSSEQISSHLNHLGGLKGICGLSDMREVVAAATATDGDEAASLALALFCYRVKKVVGSYWAVMGGVDAIIFTGGIGEHSAVVRSGCCEGLESLGIVLDSDQNRAVRPGQIDAIHPPHSRVGLFVVPTDEALQMARLSQQQLEQNPTAE